MWSQTVTETKTKTNVFAKESGGKKKKASEMSRTNAVRKHITIETYYAAELAKLSTRYQLCNQSNSQLTYFIIFIKNYVKAFQNRSPVCGQGV